MKKRLLQFTSIACMILFVGAVSAGSEHEGGKHHRMQHGHAGMMHGGHDMDRMIEHLSRMLELDEAQVESIRNITDAARPDADALRERVKANREAMHALSITDSDYDVKLKNLATENGELVTQATLLHGRIMAQVNAELTAEQQAKLSQGRDAMRKKFRHRQHIGESTDDTTT